MIAGKSRMLRAGGLFVPGRRGFARRRGTLVPGHRHQSLHALFLAQQVNHRKDVGRHAPPGERHTARMNELGRGYVEVPGQLAYLSFDFTAVERVERRQPPQRPKGKR